MATQSNLQKDGISSIATVSTLLRKAIAASLPVAPEQYMTVAIPGTVIDLENYDQGGSFVYDVETHSVAPTTVRQSEARLVDGMMPIASIMVSHPSDTINGKLSHLRLCRLAIPVRAWRVATLGRWMLYYQGKQHCRVARAFGAQVTSFMMMLGSSFQQKHLLVTA